MYVALILTAIVSYLLGSISTSIIVSKLFGVGDIRQKGSGNAGATNTLRVVGAKAAVLVVIGDALKAVIAIFLSSIVSTELLGIEDARVIRYIASVAVVIGHIYPLYFGFKGGKGIMTSIAAVLCLNWCIGLILIAIFAIVVAVFNYVSLASCISAFIYPILVCIFHPSDYAFLISAIIMAIFAIAKHKSNIKRLLNGTESKLIKSNK